jgi:hypothetical protein
MLIELGTVVGSEPIEVGRLVAPGAFCIMVVVVQAEFETLTGFGPMLATSACASSRAAQTFVGVAGVVAGSLAPVVPVVLPLVVLPLLLCVAFD